MSFVFHFFYFLFFSFFLVYILFFDHKLICWAIDILRASKPLVTHYYPTKCFSPLFSLNHVIKSFDVCILQTTVKLIFMFRFFLIKTGGIHWNGTQNEGSNKRKGEIYSKYCHYFFCCPFHFSKSTDLFTISRFFLLSLLLFIFSSFYFSKKKRFSFSRFKWFVCPELSIWIGYVCFCLYLCLCIQKIICQTEEVCWCRSCSRTKRKLYLQQIFPFGTVHIDEGK